MLSQSSVIARKMQQRRRSMGFSLRTLAQQVDCSHAYLHQVELGLRPLSHEIAARLEQVLRFSPGTLGLNTRRGRPNISPEGRRLLRNLRRNGPAPVDGRSFGRPPEPRSDRGGALQNPFGPTGLHLGERVHHRLRELEQKWQGNERFWRLVNSLRFDSWSEKHLVVQVGLRSVALTGVSPARIGCRLTCVSGSSGRDVSGDAQPAFLLEHQGAAIAWFVQRCVRTRQGYQWPDNLLVVARGETRQTVVVEVNGPEYDRDAESDRLRDDELGVPVVHVHPALLQQEDGLKEVLDRVLERLADQPGAHPQTTGNMPG